jgi:hypothetical protein
VIVALATLALAQTPTDCMSHARSAVRPGNLPDQLVSTTRPLIVHYDAAYAADQADKAAQVLTAAELSWDVQVDQLGFRAPILPDADADPDHYDIYLLEYYWGTAFVAGDTYSDDTPGDGYSGTSSYMVIDARLNSAWIDLYVAHEFNHACQWATDFTEWTLPIWEGTATAAQTWTLGDKEGKWDLDVRDFQEASHFPALLSDSYYTYYGPGLGYLYEYGAALWVRFLDEKYGVNDGAKGVELWENTASEAVLREPDVVDAFAATAGTTLGDAMNHLAVVRFLTGDDWDERGLIDAAAWGDDEAVPARQLDSADLPLVDETLPLQPHITGQVFADIDLSKGLGLDPADGEPWLRVEVSSGLSHESGIAVMWWDDAGQMGDESTWGTTPGLLIPAQGLTRVAIGITHLGPTGWDGDDSPYIDGQLALTVEALSIPPADTADTADTGLPSTTDTGEPTGGTTSPTSPTPSTTSTPSTTDGTGTDAPVEQAKGGCGCTATGGAAWWALLPVIFVARRRRSGSHR